MNTKSKKYRMVSYIIYAALLGIVHSFFQTGTNDDGWFAQVLDKYSVFEYLPMRYETWTSRLPMEWITILLTRWNPWIWKILNIAVVLVLVYGLSEVFA